SRPPWSRSGSSERARCGAYGPSSSVRRARRGRSQVRTCSRRLPLPTHVPYVPSRIRHLAEPEDPGTSPLTAVANPGLHRTMHEQNMAIVKSLVSVAWADGVFAEAEREMIDALVAAFEATEDEAKEIHAYAAEKKTLDDIPMTDLSTDDRRILLQHAVLLTF